MKKKLKIYTIIGLSLIALGIIVFVLGFAVAGFKISALANTTIKMEHYTETENANIQTVKIDYSTSDIKVVFGQELKIDYPKRYKKTGKELSKTTLQEENGTLTLKESLRFIPSVYTPESDVLTLTLPIDREFTLALETSTGDVYIPDGGRYTALSLKTSTGDIIVGKSECSLDLNVKTSTGDISISNYIGKNLNAKLSSGDISINGCCVLEKIYLDVNTGDIDMSQTIQANEFKVEIGTGDISTSGVLDASKISLKSNTGDVEMTLKGSQSDYKIKVDTNTGDCNVGNTLEGERALIIDTNTGDIEIEFSK